MGRPRKEGPVLRQRGCVWYATIYVGSKPVERSTGERDKAKAAAVACSWAEQAEAPDRPATQTTINDALSDLIEDRKAKARRGDRSEQTLSYYETKAGSLLAYFG